MPKSRAQRPGKEPARPERGANRRESSRRPGSRNAEGAASDRSAEVPPVGGTFEQHLAMLRDPGLAQPANATRRAEVMRQLQQQYGNRYVQRVLGQLAPGGPQPVQARLTVGPAGDPYEQEADRVAQQVMDTLGTSGPDSAQRQAPEEEELQAKPALQRQAPEEEELQAKPALQRQAPEEEELQAKPALQRQAPEEEELQAKPALQRQAPEEEELQMRPKAQRQVPLEGGEVDRETETQINRSKGGGQPLPDTLLRSMEGAFGSDFSGVRVHTDAGADRLNQSMSALAFTTGQDIYFRQGEYRPGNSSGQELLAHELTHVVQQNGARVARKGVARPGPGISAAGPSAIGVQRDVPATEVWKGATYVAYVRRDARLRYIDDWVAVYESLPKAPATESERDLQVNVLDKLTFGATDWLNHFQSSSSSSVESRRPGVKNLLTMAEAKKDSLEGLDFTAETGDVSVTEGTGGTKDLKQKMEGDVQSSLRRLGALIDVAVPVPGDAAKLEVALDAPVAPGATVGFELVCEAERAKADEVKARVDLTVTGGGEVGVVSLKGKLGGYIEAQAKTAQNVMELVSYGMYRRFRESSLVPREITNVLWGGGVSALHYELAEMWAAKTEQKIFGSDADAYVETGVIGAIAGEVGVDSLLKASLEFQATTGRHYDKSSIALLKGLVDQRALAGASPEEINAKLMAALSGADVDQDLVSRDKLFGRGAQQIVGESVTSFSAKAGIDAGLLAGDLSATWNWQSEGRGPSALTGWEVAGSAKGTVPLSDLEPGGRVGLHIAKFLVEMQARGKSMVEEGEAKIEENNPNVGQGMAATIVGDVAGAIDSAVADAGGAKLEFSAPESPTGTESAGSVQIQISGKFGKSGGEAVREAALHIISTKGVATGTFKTVLEKQTLLWKYP